MIPETYLTLQTECFASVRAASLKFIMTVFVINALAGIRCNAYGKAKRFRAFTWSLFGPKRYKVRFKANLLDNLSQLFPYDNVRNLQKLTKRRFSILLLKVAYIINTKLISFIFMKIYSKSFCHLAPITSRSFEDLALFRPGGLLRPSSLKSWISSKPLNLWPLTNKLSEFSQKVVVTCTWTLTLPRQPSFDSQVFQNFLLSY